MAVKEVKELLDNIKDKFSDDTSDETLSFLEDITDTIKDMESKTKDTEDWKKKYEENDKEWRERYKSRFFSGEEPKADIPDIQDNVDEPEYNGPTKFEELFTKKE